MLHVVVHDSVKKNIFVALGSYPEGEALKIYKRGEQILSEHACPLRHVTGSFFAYRFVALLRNILTGIRFVKLRLFGLRTGPVARLFGTGPTGITG